MTFATRFAGILLATCLALVILANSPAFAAELLVANKSDHTLQRLDAKSGKVLATWATGNAPHEVAVSADGSRAVVTNYGDRRNPGSSLTIIDLRAGEVRATLDLGEHRRPHGVSWIDDQILVTTEGSAHVLRVDAATGSLAAVIPTDQALSHMLVVTPDGSRAFVANIGSGSVTVIDLKTGKKLRDIPTGDGAEGIAITPDGKEVWIGNRAVDTLTILDSASLEILDTLPCSGFPIRIAIAPNGKYALLSLARSGEVALFDVAARKELKRSKLELSSVPTRPSACSGFVLERARSQWGS